MKMEKSERYAVIIHLYLKWLATLQIKKGMDSTVKEFSPTKVLPILKKVGREPLSH